MEKQNLPKKLNPIQSSPRVKHKDNKQQKKENPANLANHIEHQNLNQNNNSNELIKNKGSKYSQFIFFRFFVDQYDQKAIFLCQFCGGQSCPQQNYLVNKIQPNAIEGLHSNWITDQILATQRPSDRLIKKFNLIQAFKKYKLNTILNLQEPGQHPYCGDGIDLYNGFSYNPQTFFQNGIRFENECWEDMTATTFQHMMKIMNIFHRSINQNKGKIAVHCHAGRGRTLLVICSWLIFFDSIPAQRTIQLAIEKRQGVLTKSSQRQFLKEFEDELHKRRKVFHHIQHKTSFLQFCQWQKGCWLNHQKKIARQRPYVHFKILDALRRRLEKQSKQILKLFLNFNGAKEGWTKKQEQKVAALKKQFDAGKVNIKNDQQTSVLIALLDDFYGHLPFTLLSLHSVQLLRNQLNHQEELQKKQSKRAVTKIKNINENILKNDFTKDINELEMQSKIIKQGDHQKYNNSSSSGMEGFKKSKDSDLALFPLHLKVLYEPSIVHEIGVPGISTFLDFVLFAKQLLKFCGQKTEQNDLKSFFIKISIVLQSKKQFFPRIFRGDHLRESKLVQKIDKIQKYTNKNIIYIADFMQNLCKCLPDDADFLQKMVLKLKKVQGNIEYYKVQHKTQHRFHHSDKLKRIYDDARIQ